MAETLGKIQAPAPDTAGMAETPGGIRPTASLIPQYNTGNGGSDVCHRGPSDLPPLPQVRNHAPVTLLVRESQTVAC